MTKWSSIVSICMCVRDVLTACCIYDTRPVGLYTLDIKAELNGASFAKEAPFNSALMCLMASSYLVRSIFLSS